MTPRVISTDFSKLFNRSSKELYSEKFYEAMDMESEDLHEYDDTCSKIKVKGENDQMIQICKKYLRFLAKSTLWGRAKYGHIVSLLLNYWIYDKLKNIYRDTINDEINIAFSALQLEWSTFNGRGIEYSYYKKCEPNWNMVNHTDWDKRKKLNDYYVDFDILYGPLSTYDNLCEGFYKKIEEMIPVCEYFEGKCSETETYNCPAHYNKCKEKDIKSALENFKCHGKIKGRIGSSQEANALHSLPVLTVESSDPQDDTSLPKDTNEIQGTPSTPKSSDINTKITNSVLGATPVLLTATMLYRYTSLGPWIRRLRGGRTNNMNPMDTFSPYTQEAGDMFYNDTENYISYQPM